MLRLTIAPLLFSCLLRLSVSAQTNAVAGELIVALKQADDFESLVTHLPDGIQVKQKISMEMGLWLLQYDAKKYTDEQALDAMNTLPEVDAVQLNHRVTLRSKTPNDSLFAQQYGLLNTGQNGGTAGADIAVTKAWDISTGGVTKNGDTIVVAMVDGGMDLNHPDLVANLFVNRNEIPGNNLDDDGNGYKDDYRGLDVPNGNDNILPLPHGTQVMGIIGATGNNKIGISGVNWNIKMLPVACFTNVESSVVESYAYILKMRRMYNNSNGQKGAFVVCVNSSFGVDFGMPADFPIWCRMYDSLGKAGIISVASTSNFSQNIDTSFDIPTSCSSKFLIMVTSTDRDDKKVNGCGYGKNAVDIAAPGVDILCTTTSNGYTEDGGTSFASPQVAGVVGLMFSAACPKYLHLYNQKPDSIASDLISILLNNTDSNTALATITKSGGRLNAYKPLKYLNDMNCTIGVAEVASRQLNVFPNPATDVISIEITNIAVANIIDISGKALLNQQLHAGINLLRIADLAAGIYVLQIGLSRPIKLVVQH
ncbi:MAG: T9SS type A sorting domain-containing protein [Flavobacteriaceae bacterium]|nr:T9SS type A sorting domain-containing protein [Flavobacteriaceae bacterium]